MSYFLNLKHILKNPFHGHDLNGKWSCVKEEEDVTGLGNTVPVTRTYGNRLKVIVGRRMLRES